MSEQVYVYIHTPKFPTPCSISDVGPAMVGSTTYHPCTATPLSSQGPELVIDKGFMSHIPDVDEGVVVVSSRWRLGMCIRRLVGV